MGPILCLHFKFKFGDNYLLNLYKLGENYLPKLFESKQLQLEIQDTSTCGVSTSRAHTARFSRRRALRFLAPNTLALCTACFHYRPCWGHTC